MSDLEKRKADVVGDVLDNMADSVERVFGGEDPKSDPLPRPIGSFSSKEGESTTSRDQARSSLIETVTVSKDSSVVGKASARSINSPNMAVTSGSGFNIHTPFPSRRHDLSDEETPEVGDQEWVTGFRKDFDMMKEQMKTFMNVCTTFGQELKEIKSAMFDYDWQPEGEGAHSPYDMDWNEAGTSGGSSSAAPEEGEIVEPQEKRLKPNDDDDFLDSLMKEVSLQVPSGPAVVEKLATVITAIGNYGIAEDKREKTIKASVRPDNCPLLSVARVNSELWDLVRGETRTRDAKMQRVSQSLVAGIVPVVQVADAMMASLREATNLPSRTIMVRQLATAITLLMDAKHDLDMRRREFIRPDLQNDFRVLCNQRNPVTESLFGDELSKNIKDITELNRVTSKVQVRGNAANFRGRMRGGAFFRGRPQAGRGRFLGRPYPRRGGFYRSNMNRGKATSQK